MPFSYNGVWVWDTKEHYLHVADQQQQKNTIEGGQKDVSSLEGTTKQLSYVTKPNSVFT